MIIFPSCAEKFFVLCSRHRRTEKGSDRYDQHDHRYVRKYRRPCAGHLRRFRLLCSELHYSDPGRQPAAGVHYFVADFFRHTDDGPSLSPLPGAASRLTPDAEARGSADPAGPLFDRYPPLRRPAGGAERQNDHQKIESEKAQWNS